MEDYAMKIKVKCSCGQEHIIKIPFRLRKKVDKIELNCFSCDKTSNMRYIDKIKLTKNVK